MGNPAQYPGTEPRLRGSEKASGIRELALRNGRTVLNTLADALPITERFDLVAPELCPNRQYGDP
jgi:hypothetical protein